jgi:hypothetical protein
MMARLHIVALAAATVLTACASDESAGAVPAARLLAERLRCASCATVERPDTPPLPGPSAVAEPPPAPARISRPALAPREEVVARFAPVGLGDPSAHVVSIDDDDGIGYGVSASLLDVDGDLLPDLFIGEGGPDSSDACVYHNRSTPGAIRFERVPAWCAGDADRRSGFGIDVDNDGNDELLTGSRVSLSIVDFGGDAEIDLTPLLTEPCPVASVLHTDLDADGDADLLLSCAIEYLNERLGTPAPLVGLARTADGFTRLDPALTPWGATRVNALALAAWDIDTDGLLDVVVATDTFSNALRTNTRLEPGGVAFRCPLDAECAFERVPFLDGPRAWGSYMGSSVLRVGSDSLLYLTDWGENRALDVSVLPASSSVAPLHRLSPPSRTGVFLFTWSALVEDFDLDGDDDLFVSQGEATASDDRDDWTLNYDALLTQVDGGVFLTASEVVGLTPHGWAPDAFDATHYSSRAAARADLDLDGRLDIVINAFVGSPRAYTLTSDPVGARCTIHPLPRVVEGRHGYAVLSEDGERVDRLVEGHFQFMHDRSFTTPWRRGAVVFPSGAAVPFDCGAANDVVVVEPVWIQVTVDGCVRLTLDPSVVDGAESWTMYVDGADPVGVGAVAPFLGDGGACLPIDGPLPDTLVFARDGVVVPRRFSL